MRVRQKTRRVVGYVRVSRERPATEGVSMGAQEAELGAWALANDHRILNEAA